MYKNKTYWCLLISIGRLHSFGFNRSPLITKRRDSWYWRDGWVASRKKLVIQLKPIFNKGQTKLLTVRLLSHKLVCDNKIANCRDVQGCERSLLLIRMSICINHAHCYSNWVQQGIIYIEYFFSTFIEFPHII